MIIRHLFTPATVKCSRNIYNDRVIKNYICYSENDSEMGGIYSFFLSINLKNTLNYGGISETYSTRINLEFSIPLINIALLMIFSTFSCTVFSKNRVTC